MWVHFGQKVGCMGVQPYLTFDGIVGIAITELQVTVRNLRTHIQVVRLVTELEERRTKLLGLDTPTKHAATYPSGQRETPAYPKSSRGGTWRVIGGGRRRPWSRPCS